MRRDYAGTRESAMEIAGRLGVSVLAVKGQVGILGLAKPSGRRPWTPEEDRATRKPHTEKDRHLAISRIMHRSVNSITVRARRIRASRRNRDGWYTKSEVCEILGENGRWVQKRIDEGKLRASHHHGERPGRNEGLRAWHISEEDLREFIRRHPGELTGRNVDLLAIVDILAGVKHRAEGDKQ